MSVIEADDPDLPYHAVSALSFDDEDASSRVRLVSREQQII